MHRTDGQCTQTDNNFFGVMVNLGPWQWDAASAVPLAGTSSTYSCAPSGCHCWSGRIYAAAPEVCFY